MNTTCSVLITVIVYFVRCLFKQLHNYILFIIKTKILNNEPITNQLRLFRLLRVHYIFYIFVCVLHILHIFKTRHVKLIKDARKKIINLENIRPKLLSNSSRRGPNKTIISTRLLRFNTELCACSFHLLTQY